MTLVIVAILLLGYLLIATESLTNINKAAVAIFVGTVGWVLYICYGADFVMNQHAADYSRFLDGAVSTSNTVKGYIAQNIFLKYVGKASEIVFFLLATMWIVEILNNNGCFDFITQMLRTRKSRKMLWILSLITFLISANLDNLTTTVMMLTIMHGIIPNRRQRMYYGAAIVLAANCGGVLTVIGDSTGLVLWNIGAVSASNYSMHLFLPCLIAWILPTWWISRSLPERVDAEWLTMPYRGDDTRLNVWQRAFMLFVGIGGLWFIPTFHNITKLSPFLGAMCVLSVLWIVNEVVNRKLMRVDDTIRSRVPRVLQYGVIQMMLFVMGMMLAVGVVQETGAIRWLWALICHNGFNNVWLIGCVAGVISSVLDSFTTAISFISLHADAGLNDTYWRVIAYCTSVGGNVLSIGSISGLSLMKAEHMHGVWYFRNIGWKALVADVIGLAVLFVVEY
jgi:Na+/H+ antiporter NhaD/arsenite permease-like protein